MDVSMRERQRETTSAISLDMMPIDGCFEDALQQWLLFFIVNFRLPSDGSH